MYKFRFIKGDCSTSRERAVLALQAWHDSRPLLLLVGCLEDACSAVGEFASSSLMGLQTSYDFAYTAWDSL
jgi:hypothetical protein